MTKPRHLLREKNHHWKGENITPTTGRDRARRWFPNKLPCEVCNCLKTERHHKDGDATNNMESNIAFLCRRHHMEVDGRMKRFIAGARLSQPKALLCRQHNLKSHCKRGHPLSGENVVLRKYNGKTVRTCRLCRKIRMRLFTRKSRGHIGYTRHILEEIKEGFASV